MFDTGYLIFPLLVGIFLFIFTLLQQALLTVLEHAFLPACSGLL